MTPNIYRGLLKLRARLLAVNIELKTDVYELDFEKTIEYTKILNEIDDELKTSNGLE